MKEPKLMPDNTYSVQAQIDSGETDSNVVQLAGWLPIAIETPSSIGGLSTLTLKAAGGGGELKAVVDKDNSAYTITLGTSKFIALNPSDLPGCGVLQLVGDGAASADVAFKVICRKINN